MATEYFEEDTWWYPLSTYVGTKFYFERQTKIFKYMNSDEFQFYWEENKLSRKRRGEKGKRGRGWGQEFSGFPPSPEAPLLIPFTLLPETNEKVSNSPPDGLMHFPDLFPLSLNIESKARGESHDVCQKVLVLYWIHSGILDKLL